VIFPLENAFFFPIFVAGEQCTVYDLKKKHLKIFKIAFSTIVYFI